MDAVRRRLLAIVLGLAAVAAVVVGVRAATDDGSPSAAPATRPAAHAASDAPVFDASRYSTPTVDTLDPDPLPTPSRPPDDPHADVPVEQIGTIEIPAIGLNHPIYEGIWLTVINHGPGHWPGSAMPGERGNTVFPGHRTTYSHPFLDLDRLQPGDEVIFHVAGGDFTYKVTGTQIVVPTDLWVVDQTDTPTFTLIACHPKRSAQQRIVVKGSLVSSEPSAAALELARRVGDAPARAGA
jgi:sortase A